jgi:tRNA dimethylallyltransferase
MKPTNKKFLLVVAGPTASGKTSLAIQFARHFNTEIISADSRQFYRELPIGTAAPTWHEQSQATHHFVGNTSIHDTFDVASYEQNAISLLSQLFEKHNIVILCGGSGLFIDAVCNGLDELPETTSGIRNEVHQIYQNEGIEGLQQRLKTLDPEYFQKMDAQNPRRLQRALEVCLQSGKTYTSFRTGSQKVRPFEIIRLAIVTDRKELIQRINQRVDTMMADGFLEEANGLIRFSHLNALNTVGYKELFDYLHGQCTLEQAIEQIKVNTRRYAKRQMTWFRKNDAYTWFTRQEIDRMIELIHQRFVSGS